MLFLPKRKDLKYNLTKVLKQDKEMWVVGGCSNQWFSVLRSQVSSQSSLVRNANPQTQPQTFWLGCLWSCSDASVPGKFENPCSKARKVWELVVKTQVKGNGMDVCLAGETGTISWCLNGMCSSFSEEKMGCREADGRLSVRDDFLTLLHFCYVSAPLTCTFLKNRK